VSILKLGFSGQKSNNGFECGRGRRFAEAQPAWTAAVIW